ncbi:MAG: PAS domain S-box protein [Thermoplasmatota archaeon]
MELSSLTVQNVLNKNKETSQSTNDDVNPSPQSLQELIDLIQFTETISTKLSYKDSQEETFQKILDKFRNISNYSLAILLLSEDKKYLTIFGTTENKKRLKMAEKTAAIATKKYRIPLSKSELYKKVIYDQETIVVQTKKIPLEILPKQIGKAIIHLLGYDDERQQCIITPLKKYNEIIGALAIGSNELSTYFLSTMKHFANHIKNTLEHADEYQKRKKQKQMLSTYKLAVENAQDMVMAVNTNFEYILANKPFLTYHNLTEEEVLGAHISNILGRKTFNQIKPALSACFQGKKVKFEMNKTYPKQGKRNLKVYYYPLKDKTNKIIGAAAIISDITRRKKAKKIIDKQKKDLQTLFDSVPSAVYFKDKNARYSKINKKFCSITNIPKKQIIGKTAQEIFPKKYADQYYKDDLEVLKSGKAKYNIVKPLPSGNEEAWIKSDKLPLKDENGETIGIIGLSKDITKQQKFREKYWESEQKYQTLIQAAPVGIGLVDENGIIIDMNPAMKQLTGFSKDDFANHYLCKKDREKLKTILKEEKSLRNYEIKLQRKSGETYHALLDVDTISLNGNKLYLTIQRDISSIKNTEKKLKKTHETLTQLLNQREILIEEIHHRVKNNLQIITSLIDLQKENEQNCYNDKFYTELKNRIYLMALLHEQLYQSDDFKTIVLSDYIKNITDNLEQTYNISNKQISISVSSNREFISFKRAISCGLIINELVSNAIQHAFPQQRKGIITINITSSKKDHLISIKDNGIGFSSSFDPQQTQTLGLQLVNMLIQQLKGHIEITNKEGAHISLTIPRNNGGKNQ